MTREEAIQFLDNMKHEEAGRAIGKDGFYAELIGYHVEALNMAIKALERMAPPDCERVESLTHKERTEDEEVITLHKGALKAVTGRFVVYDLEWLKKHFNTTEAYLYGINVGDLISRQAVLNLFNKSDEYRWETIWIRRRIEKLPSVEPEKCEDVGEISDGYHTFNQLYHQRAILFAAIVNQNKDISWKSYKHSDGKYCFDSDGEWFVVGIDTPKGSYTYHYSKEYWDYFECKELGCGKEWDGHTEEDVTRLLSLEQESCEDCISRQAAINRFDLVQSDDLRMSYDDIMAFLSSLPSVEPERKTGKWISEEPWCLPKCSECGASCFGEHGFDAIKTPYCPTCGADMREVDG